MHRRLAHWCSLMCPVKCKHLYGSLQPHWRFSQRSSLQLDTHTHTQVTCCIVNMLLAQMLLYTLSGEAFILSWPSLQLTKHGYVNQPLRPHKGRYSHLSFWSPVTVRPWTLQGILSWLLPHPWGSHRCSRLQQSTMTAWCYCSDWQQF